MLKGLKNNDASYLRISTFSRFGDAQYMHFGDFLKYSKNALIGQKPEVEVITSEQKATFQNPTILMTTQSDHGLTNWLSRSKDLNDVAYLGFVGGSQKEILDLTLSPYLRKILQEDIKEGNNIHIFDIEFKNTHQVSERYTIDGLTFSVRQDFSTSSKHVLEEKFRFVSEIDDAMFIGKVISQQSLNVDQYLSQVGSDPITQAAIKAFNDPLGHEYYKEKYGLAAYIERFKSQCDSPMKQIT